MNWTRNIFSGATDSASPAWDEDALIIDVRSAGEFASGHVDGALNLPLDRFAQDHTNAAPDKSRQIIVYCHSGARSGQATRFLEQLNYEKVVNGGSPSAVALKANRSIIRLIA